MYINSVIYHDTLARPGILDLKNIPKEIEEKKVGKFRVVEDNTVILETDKFNIGIKAIEGCLFDENIDIFKDTPEGIYNELWEENKDKLMKSRSAENNSGGSSDSSDSSNSYSNENQDSDSGNGSSGNSSGNENQDGDSGNITGSNGSGGSGNGEKRKEKEIVIIVPIKRIVKIVVKAQGEIVRIEKEKKKIRLLLEGKIYVE